MFTKIGERTSNFPSQTSNKITSLLKAENAFWIGREDGVIEFTSGQANGSVNAFDLEFDCLENDDIKESINVMACTSDGSMNNILFVGNEKSIKVFKVRNKASTLDICNMQLSDAFVTDEISCLKNVHSYILNSISLNSTSDFLISSDYIKVNLWKVGKMENYFSLVDIKAQIASGCIYVINTTKFSPYHDNIFGFSSSSGELSMNDISIAPRSQSVQLFKNSYAQSIKSISDFIFVDSNFILTRSMNNLCLFDQRNPKKEVMITELVTNTEEQNILNSGDAVYDRFKLDCNGHMAYTGSCCGSVYCFDLLSNKLEEVIVNEPNRNIVEKKLKSLPFDNDKNIKIVVAEDDGFSCVVGGKVLSYKITQ